MRRSVEYLQIIMLTESIVTLEFMKYIIIKF